MPVNNSKENPLSIALEEYKEEKGVTVTAMAKECGIPTSVMHRIKKSETLPLADLFCRICVCLDLDVAEMINKMAEFHKTRVNPKVKR